MSGVALHRVPGFDQKAGGFALRLPAFGVESRVPRRALWLATWKDSLANPAIQARAQRGR
jgi:hypothetical protein